VVSHFSKLRTCLSNHKARNNGFWDGFMASMKTPPSPPAGDPEAIQRGAAQFNTLGCQTCHTPPSYTDAQLHDVGTGDPAKEKILTPGEPTLTRPLYEGSGLLLLTSTTEAQRPWRKFFKLEPSITSVIR
jgi:hypothetical protein